MRIPGKCDQFLSREPFELWMEPMADWTVSPGGVENGTPSWQSMNLWAGVASRKNDLGDPISLVIRGATLFVLGRNFGWRPGSKKKCPSKEPATRN